MKTLQAGGTTTAFDSQAGTWVININKTQFPGGRPPKRQVTTIQAIPGGVSYIDFLLPGIFVQSVSFRATQTAVGLAEIDPGVQALQVPMMLESWEELDYVRDRIKPDLEKRLEADPAVFRYSWFSGRFPNNPVVNLLGGPPGQLTPLGQAYVAHAAP